MAPVCFQEFQAFFHLRLVGDTASSELMQAIHYSISSQPMTWLCLLGNAQTNRCDAANGALLTTGVSFEELRAAFCLCLVGDLASCVRAERPIGRYTSSRVVLQLGLMGNVQTDCCDAANSA